MQLDGRMYERQELRQHLALNADILQSLEVLRLPIQELKEYLVQKTYDNPLLEIDDFPAEETGEAPAELPEAGRTEAEAPDDPDEGVVVDAAQNDIWTAGAAGGDVYLAAGGSEESFTETLYGQLGALKLDEGFAALCRYLVACLDRRGYFTEPPEEIAQLLGCTPFDVMQALYLLQSLEPAGVAARSLEECLLLQLVQSSDFNRHTIRLVKDGMALLAAGDIKGIAALLETDEDPARDACRAVRALNPIPSQGYYTGEARQTVVPDASVEKTGGTFTVVYNQRSLPTLSVSREYSQMIPETSDPEAKEYLRRNLGQARQLIKAVEKRESTLTRIITQLVRLQPRFFEDGQTLVPMTMEALAGELELNISTISRAVQGKYIVCTAGTVELKSLFSAPVGAGDNAVSASLVRERVKKLVDAEDPAHPLTDQNICDALKSMNILVSRRVIVKYREAMGIPSSSGRRARG